MPSRRMINFALVEADNDASRESGAKLNADMRKGADYLRDNLGAGVLGLSVFRML